MRPLKRQQGTWHIKCSPNHLPLADLADASVFGYVSRLNKLKMLKQLVLDQVRTQLANSSSACAVLAPCSLVACSEQVDGDATQLDADGRARLRKITKLQNMEIDKLIDGLVDEIAA